FRTNENVPSQRASTSDTGTATTRSPNSSVAMSPLIVVTAAYARLPSVATSLITAGRSRRRITIHVPRISTHSSPELTATLHGRASFTGTVTRQRASSRRKAAAWSVVSVVSTSVVPSLGVAAPT